MGVFSLGLLLSFLCKRWPKGISSAPSLFAVNCKSYANYALCTHERIGQRTETTPGHSTIGWRLWSLEMGLHWLIDGQTPFELIILTFINLMKSQKINIAITTLMTHSWYINFFMKTVFSKGADVAIQKICLSLCNQIFTEEKHIFYWGGNYHKNYITNYIHFSMI